MEICRDLKMQASARLRRRGMPSNTTMSGENRRAGDGESSAAAFLFTAGGRLSRHVESTFRPERTQRTVRSITSTRSTATRR